jgi:hypothetical protein
MNFKALNENFVKLVDYMYWQPQQILFTDWLTDRPTDQPHGGAESFLQISSLS